MIHREAKIGLLVALAFMLVVGILLSEHLTSSIEPAGAPLAQSGNEIRNAVDAPGQTIPSKPVVNIPTQVPPVESVATRDELDKPVSPQPDAAALAALLAAKPIDLSIPQSATRAPELLALTNAPTTQPSDLNQAAMMFGESIVPVTNRLISLDQMSNPVMLIDTTLAPTPDASKVKTYVAVSGDTLNKLAGRLLGANTPANRAAIIALNPSLQNDPNRIIEGATYTIPADAWSASLLATPSEPNKEKPQQARIYTVQQGDNLWKI
ncbi:MAG TPA: LysM peptidoglycan-binding domain-containing protein, partial [Tepidisphaeraceae bacterium]|nr:LysM peptidoglycan-binding domain-containing protein [Tepidisphaeraceae bacterium]